MRRMTPAEKRKKFRAALSSAITSLLIGIGLFLIPQAYTPVPYDLLQESTATVASVRSVFDIHGLSLQFVTSDGERYTLSGSYERTKVKEAIAPGDEVEIRGYQDLFGKLFRTKYAAEVTKNGETVVSFGGKRFVRFPWLRLFGALMILLGAGSVAYWRWDIDRHEKLEQMRDRRIEKKYGSVRRTGPKKMGKQRRK
ncbi:MAG: hypothetical protein II458_00075 [Oscillospiraceae bacterium]|nr:hypothetical protein [Oscillospiraceae bacterium]